VMCTCMHGVLTRHHWFHIIWNDEYGSQ
jgi:hypothetical protein